MKVSFKAAAEGDVEVCVCRSLRYLPMCEVKLKSCHDQRGRQGDEKRQHCFALASGTAYFILNSKMEAL